MMANALLTKSLSIFNSYVNCACRARVPDIRASSSRLSRVGSSLQRLLSPRLAGCISGLAFSLLHMWSVR